MRWALLFVCACNFSANPFGAGSDAPTSSGDVSSQDGAKHDSGIDGAQLDAFVYLDARPLDAFVYLDAPPPPSCPTDFAAIAGAPATSVYKIYNYSLIPANDQREGWLDAEATCHAQGAHLLIADSASEAAAVGGKITVPLLFPYYADGVTDAAVEGTWLDVLGDPADYLPWFPGQPNGADGHDGDCAILDNHGALFDYYCDSAHKYPFACECETH